MENTVILKMSEGDYKFMVKTGQLKHTWFKEVTIKPEKEEYPDDELYARYESEASKAYKLLEERKFHLRHGKGKSKNE